MLACAFNVVAPIVKMLLTPAINIRCIAKSYGKKPMVIALYKRVAYEYIIS